MEIYAGIIHKAQKICVYGPEGIGKTTFASQAPDPLFIDLENGSLHLNVKRTQRPQNWAALLTAVAEVQKDPTLCRTLVIDTADWAEQMCIDYICDKYKQPGIESFGYGKGYTYLSEEFARLLAACDEVILSGKNVVITAHAKMRKQELPDEQGAFDRWELKLSKQTAPLLKEWPDALLFLNFKTLVVATDSNTHKAQGGRRVMFTSHHPCWDAKNRHGLPEEMELSYASIAPIFGEIKTIPQTISPVQTQPSPAAEAPQLQTVTPETLQTLREWMEKAGIAAKEIQTLVAQKGHFPPETPIEQYPEKFVRNWLMHNWSQVVATIEADPEHTPF
jgi:hypothetical protein